MAHTRKADAGGAEPIRDLAERLYDMKLTELDRMDPARRQELLAEFPRVDERAFEKLRQQVLEYRLLEAEKVGWQAIPHDVTVLVFVAITVLSTLATGVVAGVACLVLLESIFQVLFVRKLYRPLSMLVWLTYPAYALLAWVLYRRGLALPWVVVAVAGAWWGTFLAGFIARLPMQLILKARRDAEADKAKIADNIPERATGGTRRRQK